MRNKITVIAIATARLLLGLVFFVFGLDGFLHFVPQPTTLPPEGAMSLAIAMMKSGYMFPLIALAWAYRGAYRPMLAPKQLVRARA